MKAIISQADYTEWTYISNGDDALALTMSGATETEYIIIDIIGDLSEDDPGEGWPVAGVPDATRNHTMVRKSSVTTGNGGNWESSAGTDGNDSEWIVYEMEDRTNLGFHIENGSGGFINDGLDDDIDWTNKSTQLSANWRSGIIEDAVHYEYAIGIFQSPSTEILSWTTTAGNSVDTAFTHTGLSLVEGATYYSHIRGLDAEGNIRNNRYCFLRRGYHRHYFTSD